MRKYEFTRDGVTYERVTKTKAKKTYMHGETVYICPVNLRPGAPYYPEYGMNRKNRESFTQDEIGVSNDFENLINSFSYYNCTICETGKYVAFYIRREEVKNA